ncbi:3-hydroxyacyl-CoA dehydrogenase [Trichinella spiralis]|uniref:3-hydroxyacyl-CoA dehydrogenase n=1 Tax=Trichinella spiralis TaxID=6334 RepID=A0ABR3K6X1_TRISP
MTHFLLLTILLHHTFSTTLSTTFQSLDQREEQNLQVKHSHGNNIGHYLQSLLSKLDISKSLKYVPENIGASWDARHQFGPLDFENSNNSKGVRAALISKNYNLKKMKKSALVDYFGEKVFAL